MDTLIHQATELANQPTTPVTPIEGRIAYVVSHGASYGSNGYAVRTQGVAQALNGHGFETLCFVRPGRPWELGASKGSTRPEVTVKGVRYIHSRWPNDRSPISESEHLAESVERFIELFRVYRPAVVMAASNYIVGLPAWVAAKRLGLPFYNEVRGFWELSLDAREPGYANTPEFKQEAERDTFVAKQALKVFTLNQPMKEELNRRGVETSRIGIVSNGVSDLPEIKAADPALKTRLGIKPDDKVIGYVGSFNPYEGLDILIEACAELIKQDEKIKLLMVGDEQPIAQANATVAKLGDQPWLIQVGRVPHAQVADYYALIDTVVIPRKKLPVSELVPPMKAAEALAYGKRLVVSDVAPLVEYAVKHECVVAFEAGRSDILALSIKKVLSIATPNVRAPKRLLIVDQVKSLATAIRGGGIVEDELFAPFSILTTSNRLEPMADASTAEIDEKGQRKIKSNNAPLPFFESEIVHFSYGESVYSKGHQSGEMFYDLSENRLEWTIPCREMVELDIVFNLKIDSLQKEEVLLKEVVVKLDFFDKDGHRIECSERIPKSPTLGNYFYLKYSDGAFTRLIVPVPENSERLEVKAIKWRQDKEVAVSSVARYVGFKNGVSVVVPSYKGQATIQECLESLSSQTISYSNFEIIVVLNGEPDDTESIINDFCDSRKGLNVLVAKNAVAGAGSARNYGISLARFKYITFVDDDDLVSPNFLKGLLENASDKIISVSNIIDFTENGYVESPINGQISINSGKIVSDYACITSAVTLNACKLMLTRFAKAVKYNSALKSGEDVDYWSRLVCLFEPEFKCVEQKDDIVYYRRLRENSVSRQVESFEFNVRQRLQVIKELECIESNNEMKGFIESKVNAQLGFVFRYLEKYPSEWARFKRLAEDFEISSRAIQYVNGKVSKKLVVSYCFPPFIDTAGIVCTKRIIEDNKPVDVISNTMEGVRKKDDRLLGLVKPYVGNFLEIKVSPSFSSWKAIETFCDRIIKSLDKLINKYNELYSRSMWPGSHFAAALLKIKYPNIRWVAEFSDPLRVDVNGKERKEQLDKSWLINNNFLSFIKDKKIDVEINDSLFYWCEVLPYIFADEIIFTNKSQKKYMLKMIDSEKLRKHVDAISIVSNHPTLPEKYYNLSSAKYELDSKAKNIGYFGSFYSTRGISEVVNAINFLTDDDRKYVKLHIFTPQSERINILGLGENIVVNDVLAYLDFLSLSKSFDVLVVNDAVTAGVKWINPYLPSKLSDYLGSGANIWALYEEGSELHQVYKSGKIKYGSLVSDLDSCIEVMERIVQAEIGYEKITDHERIPRLYQPELGARSNN